MAFPLVTVVCFLAGAVVAIALIVVFVMLITKRQ